MTNPASVPEHRAADTERSPATEAGAAVLETDCATWRGRAEALAAASNMWRAQAEALAGALNAITRRVPVMGPGDDYRDGQWAALAACAEVARAALARLPAQALAERRALEAEAGTLRNLLVEALVLAESGAFTATIPTLQVSQWAQAALAALDVARGEP